MESKRTGDKTAKVNFRASKAEAYEMQAAAKRAGVKVSAFIRRAIAAGAPVVVAEAKAARRAKVAA